MHAKCYAAYKSVHTHVLQNAHKSASDCHYFCYFDSIYNLQESSKSDPAIAKLIAAARADEQQKAQKAIDKLRTELEAFKAAKQRAIDHATAEQEKDTKRSVARRIVAGNLTPSAKEEVLLLLSDSPHDQFCIRAYCQNHTNHFVGDFNARMVEKRKMTLSTESTQSMDGDAGMSITQSTGLPEADVYV